MKVILIILAVTLFSCSSNLKSPNNESLVKDDKMIGDSLPSWTSQDSDVKDGRLYLTGYSEMSADKNPTYISKAALMDAEVRLISDAPAEIRVVTQNALTGAGFDSSEFFQIQTKLQEVVGLMGFKSHESTCRKFIRYGETTSNVTRGCWMQASVSLIDLRKAYLMTMKLKYSEDKVTKFDDLMKQELEKINSIDRFNKKESKSESIKEVKNENKINQ